MAWRVRPAQRDRRAENNIGTRQILGLLLAPMMLESGKFPLTARLSLPGLLRGSQAGVGSVRRVRRAIASSL
jgi:hypothetical protein